QYALTVLRGCEGEEVTLRHHPDRYTPLRRLSKEPRATRSVLQSGRCTQPIGLQGGVQQILHHPDPLRQKSTLHLADLAPGESAKLFLLALAKGRPSLVQVLLLPRGDRDTNVLPGCDLC